MTRLHWPHGKTSLGSLRVYVFVWTYVNNLLYIKFALHAYHAHADTLAVVPALLPPYKVVHSVVVKYLDNKGKAVIAWLEPANSYFEEKTAHILSFWCCFFPMIAPLRIRIPENKCLVQLSIQN